MKNRLFSPISALSLVLAVLTCIQWGRSYWVADGVMYTGTVTPQGGQTLAGACSIYGVASFYLTSKPDANGNVHHTINGVEYQPTSWLDSISFPVGAATQAQLENQLHFGGLLGFGYSFLRLNGLSLSVIILPQWVLVILFSIPPAIRVFRQYRAAGRNVVGRCDVCGYDLRGTPDRCPECGTVPKKVL